MFLDYFALFLLIFIVLVLFYGIIAVHDIPYEIAKHRNHPHQDAIHIGGWISLFTLHAIWPFLWIWATLYRPERGYGFGGDAGATQRFEAAIAGLETRVGQLEAQMTSGRATNKKSLSGPTSGTKTPT
ncbi:MAG TPA: DUF3302 domain-containing protein [Methyloceanibacter sp.]|nr:DUF3302 domain-containing protein [Hyphomicrobiaceae bacterium]HLC07655.1 DUF3302 domain-containing protein [Methyloceanibacter sp.]